MKARHTAAERQAESAEGSVFARGRSLLLSRAVAWSVVPLYVAGICAFFWLERLVGVSGGDPAEGAIIAVGFGAFAVVGALLVAKRPANPIGWILASVALMVGLFPAGDAYAAYVMTTQGRPDTLAILGAWMQSWYWYLLLGLTFVYLPLLFPDGRLPSRRWLPVALLAGVGISGSVVLGMLTATLTGQEVDYRIENPIGIEGMAHVEGLPVFGALGVLIGLGAIGAVAAVAVRFRRSRGVERQQIKWFLFAVAPLLLVPALDFLPEIIGGVMFGWVLVALPAAIGISILRHRLYDIDLIINRALVYVTLTAGVIGVYVFVVGYLGAMFRTEANLPISLVATGVVAVLFAPLRDRLQRAANRLMYGERDDPYAAISRLGERLEATLAPDAVLPTIVQSFRDALRLPYAAIAFEKEDEPQRVVASVGEPTKDPLRLPLTYRSEPVGELLLGSRAGEEGFSSADRRLLSDLARQAGVAVHAVRLTADLQRSREKLVTTREEERRRLRRDLHDGLGAQLAGLNIQTGVLRSLIKRDPDTADALVVELRGEMRSAIADVRRLVHGLRPPALDELGLVGALHRLAERPGTEDAGLRVEVETPEDLPPLPAAVEVATYRIVQEALTNVVRHARADECVVRLTLSDDEARLEISDDGIGLPEARPEPGVGLHSMRERAVELGGSCAVETAPGGGFRVIARLPLQGGG